MSKFPKKCIFVIHQTTTNQAMSKTTTIIKKVIMSLTGLFLILFLTGHLIGNFQLFAGDDGYAYNTYAIFMTTNPAIKLLSYATYFSFLLHVVYSIILTLSNMKARPQGYKGASKDTTSTFASRYMIWLGSLVAIFLAIHLANFWWKFKTGATPMISYPAYPELGEIKDLYIMVVEAFKQWWIITLYLSGLVGLAYHLSHGFQSAFQTLGLNHKKYTPVIKAIGMFIAIGFALAFASMPVYFFYISL